MWRLPIPRRGESTREAIKFSDTVREIKEGLAYIAHEPRVRGVIVGLGVGVIGAGAMIPFGPAYAKQGLGGDAATYGVMMSALGFGAAIGVVGLLFLQKRLPRETVFDFAIIGTGIFLMVVATFTSLFPAALAVGLLGACAGTSYVTGFTVLAGDRARRHARPYLCHALHGDPHVPARGARHLAVVGRLLGLDRQ